MAYERQWPQVTQLFTANGSAEGGIITVADTSGFYVKQQVNLISLAFAEPLPLEIKRIDVTHTIHVGPPGDILLRADVSGYLLADAARITANEQRIPPFNNPAEINNAEFEREPIKAKRVILIDKYGRPYDVVVDNNGVVRLAVDASLSLTDVTVDISNPTKPTIANISIPTENVEQAYVFPAKTKTFLMRLRDGKGLVQFAFTLGDSSVNFITMSYGCNYNSGDIDPADPFTIYFQCSLPGKVLEILSWQL